MYGRLGGGGGVIYLGVLVLTQKIILARPLTKALVYFWRMKGTEWCQPNAETCNILLRAFAQARNVNQVNALFKDLDESIVSPDI
jgi:pentatricopeptide repeat protein